MAVSIPISANAQGVIDAFDQVREAIRRAGQEGKSFATLDLSHPELQGFSQDLARMQQQMEDLLRLGRGATAQAARNVHHIGGLDMHSSEADRDYAWETVYADPAQRARLRAQAESYILRGTAFAPAPPPPPPAPPTPPPLPPSSGSGGGGGREDYSNEAEDAAKGLPPIARSIARAAVQGATFGLSLAGVGGIRSVLAHGYHQALEENSGVDAFMRSLTGLSVDFEELRNSVREAGKGLGVTNQEMLRLERSFTRIVGDSSDYGHGLPPHVDPVTVAAGLARGFGISPQAATQGIARGEAAGIDASSLAMMVADAAAKGMQTGNLERVMESILKYTESTSRVLISGHGNVEGFAGMWTAMQATMNPGWRGEGAASTLNTIDQSLRDGGNAGPAGDALIWRALSSHGIKDPLAMERFKEGGMFAQLPDGTTYWEAVKEQVERVYGPRGNDSIDFVMKRLLGPSMHDFAEFRKLRPADVAVTRKYLADHHIDTSTMNGTAYSEISKLLNSTNPAGDLQAQREKLLRRSDIDESEKDRLRHANPSRLQEEVVRSLAAHGMTPTPHSAAVDASTDLGNRITEFGQLMVPPMTALKDALVTTNDTLKSAFGLIGQFFGGGTSGAGSMPFLGGDSNSTMAIAASFMAMAGGPRGRGLFTLTGGLGAGGANVALPRGEADRRAQVAFDYFKSQGWSDEQTAGLVANLHAESGMRTNVPGDGGISGGLAQWNHERRARFREMFGHDVLEGTLEEQLQFVQWELTHTHKAAGDELRRQRTARGAGGVISKMYEAPKVDSSGPRGSLAERMLPGLRGHHPPGTHAPAPAPAAPRDPNFIQASFHPLEVRVIHEDSHGRERRRETLYARPITPPASYGV